MTKNLEPFVPIEDLAKHFNVSISTVRAWVRQEHIPKDTYIQLGSTYRFRVGDVANALTKIKVEKRIDTAMDTMPIDELDDLVDEDY